MTPAEQWRRYAELLERHLWPHADPDTDTANAIKACAEAACRLAEELETEEGQ